MADHPFILEFLIHASDYWPITNHRRLREHRNLTLLLNVLLAGRASLRPRRSQHFWARAPGNNGRDEIKWVQEFFFAELGKAVTDQPSPLVDEWLEKVEPEEYYTKVGPDGKGLRVPTDLDQSICCYAALSAENRARFDRATFWMDMAWRQWNISVSASFAALVSAAESLINTSGKGATKRFRAFFEKYAPGVALSSRRDEMYDLRSGILHGSDLMQLDQDLAFGWDPPWWNERELHEELWRLTRTALHNWLKNPPGT